MSQALVILASVGLGALVTVALSTFGKIKRLRSIKSLNKQIKTLEGEKTTISTKSENLEKENVDLQQINSDLKTELGTSEEKIKELSTRPVPQQVVEVKEENSVPVDKEEQTD
jgi:flagellar motor switch/type III secretory pathway protein FliN